MIERPMNLLFLMAMMIMAEILGVGGEWARGGGSSSGSSSNSGWIIASNSSSDTGSAGGDGRGGALNRGRTVCYVF